MDVKDFFWRRNAGNPFPKVAGNFHDQILCLNDLCTFFKEDVDAELTAYKAAVEEVNKLSSLENLTGT